MKHLLGVPEHGLVKICGLREPNHAAAAAKAGADLIGFIFAPTRRQVTPEQAAICIRAARAVADRPIVAVGVFVNADRDEIEGTRRVAGLDLIQLHGDEPAEFLSAIPIPVVKAFKPRPGALPNDSRAQIQDFMEALCPPAAFVIDGYDPGQAGGTGSKADWNLVASLAREFPVLLAGGLDPDNVGEAISRVQPIGVDVSSGVEFDGVKSEALIERFVTNARLAFDWLPTAP